MIENIFHRFKFDFDLVFRFWQLDKIFIKQINHKKNPKYLNSIERYYPERTESVTFIWNIYHHSKREEKKKHAHHTLIFVCHWNDNNHMWETEKSVCVITDEKYRILIGTVAVLLEPSSWSFWHLWISIFHRLFFMIIFSFLNQFWLDEVQWYCQ